MSADLPAYNGDDSSKLPMPGTLVIAPDGTVHLAFVDADRTNIPHSEPLARKPAAARR